VGRPRGRGEGQPEGLERLLIGPENPLEQIDIHRAETFERFGELQLEHSVCGVVLRRKLDGRRRRLPTLDRLRVEVLHADVTPERRLIEVP